ncbi:MAG: hypothetical protein AAFZ49_00730 [Cyanobacteria bacterium J06659_2]
MDLVNQFKVFCKLGERRAEDTQPPNLTFEIFVDGQAFTDFSYYAVDLAALVQSMHQDGQFYIITCGCGVPDCIGIVRGINVLHRQGLVSWLITQPRPSRTLTFERTSYEEAIYAAIHQGRQMITDATQNSQNIEIFPLQNKKLLIST